MKAQYVMDSEGRKTAVLLPIKDYEKMMQLLEDYEDIKACQESRKHRKHGQSNLVSLDEVLKKIGTV